MRLLLDTNVVLDVLLARAPHAETAARVLSACETGVVDGVLCATTVTTLYYLLEKAANKKTASQSIAKLLKFSAVANVNNQILQSALELDFSDYEDAVLHQAALANSCDAIVTRNQKDFRKATLPVYNLTDIRDLLAL